MDATGSVRKGNAPICNHKFNQHRPVEGGSGGTAPMEIKFIRLDSRTTNESVTWGTISNWSLSLILTNGPNTFTAKSYDRFTNFISGATNSLTNSP